MTRRMLAILSLIAVVAAASAAVSQAMSAMREHRPERAAPAISTRHHPVGMVLPTAPAPAATARFAYVDIFIDTRDAALAAYQFDLRDTLGLAKIVGLEGNAELPYQNPPFYDPAAMQGDRVIVAGYSATEAQRHPTGRIRVARVHVMIEGDREPKYEAKITAAAAADGSAIAATIQLSPGSAP